MPDGAALPNSSHIVVTMCEGMDLNIVTREGKVVLPRVEIEIEGDSDDEDEEEGEALSPEQVAEMEAKLKDLIVKEKKEGKEGDADEEGEWEDEDDDSNPPAPRLESEIDPEHAPALYKATTVLDIEDLAFPNALLGVATLAENVETVRIKSVPSSGFLGDWPMSVKNVIVWHEQMNYEYGPYMDSDDEDDSDEEDEEEEGEEKKDAEKEEKEDAAEAEKKDEEEDPDYVPGEDSDDEDDEETILCTSRFVLNVTPSHPTTPRVTKALEQLINVLDAPLEEITVIFNVDKEYKQPKDYEPADDSTEPPLLLFLLTLLTMCANDSSKITFVDFDKTGVEWLGDKDNLPAGIDTTGVVPPEIAQKVFEEFLNGGIEEVRDEAKADGLGDVGVKRDVKYLTRDEYKAAIGEEQFKLHTQWEL